MLIPAAAASAEVDGCVSIQIYSHNANFCASGDYRNPGNDLGRAFSHNANMLDDDKNGGPNHLRAWMKFRKVKGAELAEALGISAGMVSDLANSKRALSAKWLRRLADALHTTPGLLLDHDPQDLDRDIIDMWVNASAAQRRQLKDVAQALVKTGTEG
ncbi:MAG: helix-turn-helix transcriptional regulator [Sphingobium limneticum]